AGAESRHNLTYWRYHDYAGIGPGAHGRRGGMATMRHKKPENWMGAVARNGHGLVSEEPLSPTMRRDEALLMGLRLREGIDLAQVAARSGAGTDTLIDTAATATLAREGLIARVGDQLWVTDRGMLVLNAIIAALVPDR
ncbi:MAG: coproporphyrinogen III oxidase, partial [Sphingomonas hengshuiensis]